MSPQLLDLALKKQRLQMQSAQLRNEFALHSSALLPAFAVADLAHAGILWLKKHPALPIAMLVALLVARPRAALSQAARLWALWRGVQRFRGVVLAALSRLPRRRP